MNTILSNLCTLQDRITQFAVALAAIGLMLIVTSYVYEVVTRYFFNSPTAWVSDFVSYALAACIFMALPRVTKDKAHVAVTILVDILPAKFAGTVHTAVSIIGFICLAIAAYVSLQENIRQFTKNIETLAIIPIPQWWVSGFITFGLALSSLYMLRYLSATHRTSDNTIEETVE
jgi:TRAP-type C4-dicarboxylate transport system permease small subunit